MSEQTLTPLRAIGGGAVLALCTGLLVGVPTEPSVALPPPIQVGSTRFVDINPENEGQTKGQPGVVDDCPDPCASGESGGRVNGLAVVPDDPTTYFAASEVGGLYKSVDGGTSWTHLDDHVPSLTWDVAAAVGGQLVYATSFYDGRVEPLTGLQVSTDGGTTWTHPTLPAPSSCPSDRVQQASAFGIARRDGSGEALVGTNCGIARTIDGGGSWLHFDLTPGDDGPGSVWDIVALPGGRTYACGDDGLLTSPDGTRSSWTLLGKPPITAKPIAARAFGYCSLAASPEESDVLFAAFGNPFFGEVALAFDPEFYEIRVDLGAQPPSLTWGQLPYPDDPFHPTSPDDTKVVKKQRVPFVVTNDRAQGFDLWMGDGALWRVPCSSQSQPRCSTDPNTWDGSFTDHLGENEYGTKAAALQQGAHGDSGDLEFNPLAPLDACPTLFSNDGGIHRNRKTAHPDCQAPTFEGVNHGLHAFLLWGMDGVRVGGANPAQLEDIYFATQDVGLFVTRNAGSDTPTWTHGVGADDFDVVADQTRIVVSDHSLLAGDPGFTNMKRVLQDCDWPQQGIGTAIAQAGPGRYMMARAETSCDPDGNGPNPEYTIPRGVYETSDVTTSPPVDANGVPQTGNNALGTPLGAWPSSRNPCHIEVAAGSSGPQPWVLAGKCVQGRSHEALETPMAADELFTFQAGSWVEIPPPPKHPGEPVSADAGFAIFGADPNDADRIYAAVVRDGPPRMMRSRDGGATWEHDAELSELMTGGFRDFPQAVEDGVFPYPQPSMVAFDPYDPDIVVAAGRESGIFLSSDGGDSWALLTDPHRPGETGIPHLPRPRYVHFDHDAPGKVRIYVGSVGRGVWRIDLATSDLSVGKDDSPDPVAAGTDLTYTVPVTNGGPDIGHNVTFEDHLPPGAEFKSLSAPAGWTCDTPAVGSAGSITCSVQSMPVGTATFTITVHVPFGTAGGATLTNSVQVVGAVIDGTAANNADTEQTAVVVNRDTKQAVRDDLAALQASATRKKDRDRLAEAVKHLDRSLDPVLWTDANHPDEEDGGKVFEQEKKAVHKLLEIRKDPKSIVSGMQGFIDALVGADRFLAEVAIADAAGGDPAELAKANQELGKGDTDAGNDKPGEAITHYRKAWQHAIKAKP